MEEYTLSSPPSSAPSSPPSSPAPAPVVVIVSEPVVVEPVVVEPVVPVPVVVEPVVPEPVVVEPVVPEPVVPVPVVPEPVVPEPVVPVPVVVEPVVPVPVVPEPVLAVVPEHVLAVEVPVKALIKLEPIDVLYNKMILNSSLLSAISDLKTNGFTNASVPLLILSVMSTYNSYTAATPVHTLGTDDIQVLLERVYNYFVEKYDLIDVPNRLAMYNLFDASLKLCLAMPNVKKEMTSCLKFFRCAK